LRLPEQVNEIADKVEAIFCDVSEIKATLEQLLGILGKGIERRTLGGVPKSLGDKQLLY